MSKTGFFRPLVTPEWIDSSTKTAFAVIVNNDNGLSKDYGNYTLRGKRADAEVKIEPHRNRCKSVSVAFFFVFFSIKADCLILFFLAHVAIKSGRAQQTPLSAAISSLKGQCA